MVIGRPAVAQSSTPKAGKRNNSSRRFIQACYSTAKERQPCFRSGSSRVLPYYIASMNTYAEDGGERRENITDWALQEFQTRYGDPTISKWDIFHYVYAVLHHPQYRERYAANLRRELPRIPLVRSAGLPTRSSPVSGARRAS